MDLRAIPDTGIQSLCEEMRSDSQMSSHVFVNHAEEICSRILVAARTTFPTMRVDANRVLQLKASDFLAWAVMEEFSIPLPLSAVFNRVNCACGQQWHSNPDFWFWSRDSGFKCVSCTARDESAPVPPAKSFATPNTVATVNETGTGAAEADKWISETKLGEFLAQKTGKTKVAEVAKIGRVRRAGKLESKKDGHARLYKKASVFEWMSTLPELQGKWVPQETNNDSFNDEDYDPLDVH
jgi:hypothetical protein